MVPSPENMAAEAAVEASGPTATSDIKFADVAQLLEDLQMARYKGRKDKVNKKILSAFFNKHCVTDPMVDRNDMFSLYR